MRDIIDALKRWLTTENLTRVTKYAALLLAFWIFPTLTLMVCLCYGIWHFATKKPS